MISWGKQGHRRIAAVAVAAALVAGLVATPALASGVPGLPGDTPAGAASSGAPGCSLQPTGGPVTVPLGALGERNYRLYVPQSLRDLPPGTPVPLLTSFHGLGGSSDSQADLSDWESDAETHRFIVAFPNAVGRVWRSGANSEDVAFARSVVADIQSTYCIDRARIHADGLSNGAQFTYRLACDAPDLYASYAEIAGSEPVTDRSCAPSRPVAIHTSHSNADRVIAIDRDRQARDAWVARNGCDPTPVVEEPTSGLGGNYSRYLGCDGDVEVSWREYIDSPHVPDEPTWADYRALTLAFFARYPHPAHTRVAYDFAGFFAPVDNSPVVNRVNAGSTVPVKFSLGGFRGFDVFAADSPASRQLASCAGASSEVDELEPDGSAGLSYDSTTDRYNYRWKTKKDWSGQCRDLAVTLADGTVHTARFLFS